MHVGLYVPFNSGNTQAAAVRCWWKQQISLEERDQRSKIKELVDESLNTLNRYSIDGSLIIKFDGKVLVLFYLQNFPTN